MKTKRNLTQIILTVASLLLATVTNAAPNGCVQGVLELGSIRDFWNSNNALLLSVNPNKKLPVTFGFDAEVWGVNDIVNMLSYDPQGMKEMRKQLIVGEQTYTPSKFKRLLGFDDIDDAHAAILDGAVEPYTILDLEDWAFEYLETTPKLKNAWADLGHKVLDDSLARRGIPVNAILEEESGARDDHAIELVMKGSITEPRKFSDLLSGFLYKEVLDPETHFHMGIPSGAVNREQMTLMARALEAKMLFDETLEGLEYTTNFAPYDNSTISKPDWQTTNLKRGVVRVDFDRWTSPHPAHDVEIRNWMDLDHAKELMHFMGQLGLNANRLRKSAPMGKHIPKSMPANLNNTLRYLAFMLENRVPTSMKPTLRSMETLAAEIERQGRITDSKREQVRELLEESGIKPYITFKLFLE